MQILFWFLVLGAAIGSLVTTGSSILEKGHAGIEQCRGVQQPPHGADLGLGSLLFEVMIDSLVNAGSASLEKGHAGNEQCSGAEQPPPDADLVFGSLLFAVVFDELITAGSASLEKGHSKLQEFPACPFSKLTLPALTSGSIITPTSREHKSRAAPAGGCLAPLHY